VWLGSSDLTIKTNDTVDIRENPKEVIDNLIKNFEDIDYTVCKVTFNENIYPIYVPSCGLITLAVAEICLLLFCNNLLVLVIYAMKKQDTVFIRACLNLMWQISYLRY
jgi:hypothetical protein